MARKFAAPLLTTLSLVGLSVLVQATPQRNKDAPPDLLGSYTIVSGEKNGQAIPEEQLKGSIVVFGKDEVSGTDKDKKQFFAATYTLDATSKPIKIRMTTTAPKIGDKADGLIEVEGDMVRLCYALPGGEVPTNFKSKDKQHCFVLKRTK